MGIAERLFHRYEEHEARSRTSTPFIDEENCILTLHFGKGLVQSRMHLNLPDFLMLGYTRTMIGFLLFNSRPRHIGMIGLGGGSIPKYCYRHLPHSRISVAEISPEVIALRDRFYIPEDDCRFKVFCEDGADFVRRHSHEFDVLIVDGFDMLGQPEQLCSQQFYYDCYNSLTSNGVLVVNLSGHGHRAPLRRVRYSFPSRVVAVSCENGDNHIVFAGKGRAFASTDSEYNESAVFRKQYHPIKFN
jgi:spermidine synthase